MCSGFNGGFCSNGSLLGYYAMYHTKSLPTFRKKFAASTSGSLNFIHGVDKVISVHFVGSLEGMQQIKDIERAERIDYVRDQWK
jgi:hypothetical protein